MRPQYAGRVDRVRPSAIRELLKYGQDAHVLSFGGGYPDPDYLPVDELNAIYRALISRDGKANLQYATSAGLPSLREAVAAFMTEDGTPTEAGNVLILHGAQQGLDLVVKLLVDAGDVIVTESPTFLGALAAFNPCEPRYATVRTDSQGIDTRDLERVLESHPSAKFIYTVPDFQNPTGVTMSVARRHELIELACRFDVMVLEDSPYRQIRYEGTTVPTIKSMDRDGRVIYLGSFSKILAPGLRLGWAAAAPEIIEKLELLKLAADTQCSTLNMAAAAAYMNEYGFESHLRDVRSVYRLRRDAMLDALAEYFPSGTSWTVPQGGLFTWVGFPESVDTERFLADVAVPVAGVAYVPGASFFAADPKHHYGRFSFASTPPEDITRGIKALGASLQQFLADSPEISSTQAGA